MKGHYLEAELKMQKSVDNLTHEYGSIRVGRANPGILDKIRVDYYGTATAINQMAAISIPEARTLIIQPWDASSLKAIEKAITTSDIGINPNNDGKVLRLNFPALTEERRREIVKEIFKLAENCKVAIRNIRRDTIDHYKALKKKSEITEDDLKVAEKDLQELTDKTVKAIDTLTQVKEKEILTV